MGAIVYLSIVVLVAFTVEAAIGFGATLVTLSLGSLVLQTEALLFIIVPLNALLSAAVVLRARRAIDVRALGMRILPAMLVGFPLGLLALRDLPPRGLKLVFAAFVIVLAVVELSAMARAGVRREVDLPKRPLALLPSLLLLFLGGVAHGALATGGPPVVYVAARTLPDKATFRATVSALWLVLNALLIVAYVASGGITWETLQTSLPLIPSVVAGLLAGEWLHGRVSEEAFRRAVFVMLLVVAVVLASRA